MNITAHQVLKLLAAKHSKDIFVPECKTGPTQVGHHQRLDAWAMPRSWVNHTTIGYEIKVSRQDFLGDKKWRGYLEFCHQFYFVCPPGIIEPSELDEGIGLLVTSKNGTRLYTKRKAAFRDIQIPTPLWIYILMCRVTIEREYNYENRDQIEFWRNWLEKKGKYKDVGYRVSSRLRELFRQKVDLVQSENEKLRRSIDNLQEIKTFCDTNRISYDGLGSRRWELEKMIDQTNGKQTLSEARRLIKTLTEFALQMETLTKDGQETFLSAG